MKDSAKLQKEKNKYEVLQYVWFFGVGKLQPANSRSGVHTADFVCQAQLYQSLWISRLTKLMQKFLVMYICKC